MQAVESLGDSLDWESDAIKKQAAADHGVIYGEAMNGAATEAEADMKKTLIAGDVHYHYSSPADAKAATAEPAAAVTPTVPRATKEQIDAYVAKKVAKKLAAAQATPMTTQPVTLEQQSWLAKYWPAVVGGAIGIGGVGTALMTEKTEPATPPAATEYKFDISSEQGKGFTTNDK